MLKIGDRVKIIESRYVHDDQLLNVADIIIDYNKNILKINKIDQTHPLVDNHIFFQGELKIYNKNYINGYTLRGTIETFYLIVEKEKQYPFIN